MLGGNFQMIIYSRDSHLEETEYTGNKYTPVIREQGIRPSQ